LLFNPQEWSVQTFPLDKLVISVTGFTGVEQQGIILWIEKLGGTYAESVSNENTHLVAHHQNSDCSKASESVHQVSISWLYDVMQQGYKGNEDDEDYRVPITIKIREESGKGRDIYVNKTETTPISEVLETYADAEEAEGGVYLYNFFFGGRKIVNHDATLPMLELNDGDTIKVEVNKDIIKVLMQDESENGIDWFVNKRSTLLSEMFQEYAEHRGIDLSRLEFYFKDEMIKNLIHTPMTLGLCDGCIIKVVDIGSLPITIRIRDMDTNNESMFKVKKRTRVERLFQEYADREDVYLSNLVFYLDGERIDDYNATPLTLKLEDDDQIDVIVDCRSSSPSVAKAKNDKQEIEDTEMAAAPVKEEDDNLDDDDKKMLAAMEADEEDENASCKRSSSLSY